MAGSRMDGIGKIGGGYLAPVGSLLTAVLVAIRSSFLGFVVAVGSVLLLVSVLVSDVVFPGVNSGMLAGMTFIWAVSAFLYAALGKIVLALIGYS